MDITAGIVAQKKNLAVLHVQCRRNHQQKVNHAPGTPIPSSQSIIPVLPSMLQPISVLRPMQRARHLLGRCRSRSRDARHPSGPYNNAPGNGRNDYAEFSHGEHPKSQRWKRKIGLNTSFSKENSEHPPRQRSTVDPWLHNKWCSMLANLNGGKCRLCSFWPL